VSLLVELIFLVIEKNNVKVLPTYFKTKKKLLLKLNLNAKDKDEKELKK
jgi:hypothetical protein